MAETLSTNYVAEELGTDPKTLRRFLRSDSSPVTPVGQGNRYAITKADLRKLRKAFPAWQGGPARKGQPIADAA